VGLDRIRWQERARSAGFYLGLLTSLLVLTSWVVNLIHKHLATLFGGSVTLIGFALAYSVRRGWIGSPRHGFVSAEAAETAGGKLETAVDILTLGEAIDMRPMYASTTLVAMRAPNLRLFQEAAARAHGKGEQAVYLLFVDEVPGLFFPPKTGPSREARQVMAISADYFRRAGLVAVPLWRMAHDAGASIANAAQKLGAEVVMVGTSQRSAVWHLLRGNVLESLVRELPAETRVWICN
jgi:nucleotide-binding universal stress UspA family protein